MFMRLLVGEMKVNYMVSNLFAIIVCSVINFLISDRLVFRRKGLPLAEPDC